MTFYRKLLDGALQQLTAEEAIPYENGILRHHVCDGLSVCFTEQEEIARDEEEVAFQNTLSTRAIFTERIMADQSELATCILDSQIINLIDQTRIGWRTWAGNNFPSLTSAEKVRLGDLFWVVSLGVRKHLRLHA